LTSIDDKHWWSQWIDETPCCKFEQRGVFMLSRMPGKPFIEQEIALLWRCHKAGASAHAIGRILGRDNTTVSGVIGRAGGVAPLAHRRAARILSSVEREEISRGLFAWNSIRAIARSLHRAPSTISQEVKRNGGRFRYRASRADTAAWKSASRPKPCLLSRNKALADLVASKLCINWSPQQISAWLRETYPDSREMHVSHETIYRTLFVQTRGALKKELLAHLRSRRRMRHSGHGSPLKKAGRGQIVDAVSIRERPADVEDRAVPGHWEGDLVMGSNGSFIATLVERSTRYVMLTKVENKKTDTVVPALIKTIRRLPRELRKSVTWDRGLELAEHKKLSVATNIKVYFCDPHSPWQRGSNENTNGLLRQYFPKRMDLTSVTPAQLAEVAQQLNERPRETLGWKTPAYKLAEVFR
jgi:IS30 family transposase